MDGFVWLLIMMMMDFDETARLKEAAQRFRHNLNDARQRTQDGRDSRCEIVEERGARID